MNAFDGEKLEGSHIRAIPPQSAPIQRQQRHRQERQGESHWEGFPKGIRRLRSCKVDDAGMSKGFAFINFEREDGAREAVERANGAFLHGKKL